MYGIKNLVFSKDWYSEMICVQNLHKSYESGNEQKSVLSGLNLEAGKGDMLIIMGPSGSGKTTLLNILGGIDRPDNGSVEVGDNDLTEMSGDELREYRRKHVGFIFQFYNLIPTLNATENVELGCEVLDWDGKKVEKESKIYLERVGLQDHAQKFPQQLSAGEQQRVAIARALAKQPKIIFGDEPTGNLDEETSFKIIKLLREVNKKHQTTMIIVSHDPELRNYADRTLRLRMGELKETENGL